MRFLGVILFGAVLSACTPGTAVLPSENQSQRPAFQYSDEYYCSMGYYQYCTQLVDGDSLYHSRGLNADEQWALDYTLSHLPVGGPCSVWAATWLANASFSAFDNDGPGRSKAQTVWHTGHQLDIRLGAGAFQHHDSLIHLIFHEVGHFQYGWVMPENAEQTQEYEDNANALEDSCGYDPPAWLRQRNRLVGPLVR